MEVLQQQSNEPRVHEGWVATEQEESVAIADSVSVTMSHASVTIEHIQTNMSNVEAVDGVDKSPMSATLEETNLEEIEMDQACSSTETEVNGRITPTVAHSTQDQPHIVFVDPNDTRWDFPFEDCKTWNSVKESIKSIFVSNEALAQHADLLDEGPESPGQSFCLVRTSPGHANVLSRHWESLVSPGWEFMIEFRDNPPAPANAGQEEDNTEETKEEGAKGDEVEASKIVYVANYLTFDGDFYTSHSTERSKNTITGQKVTKIQNPKCILEEHREVCCEGKDISMINTGVANPIGNPVIYVRSPILLNALKAVIDYQSDPDQFIPREWNGNQLHSDLEAGRFIYPFTDLYHYRERLARYREEVKQTHDEEYSQTCRDHIDVLLEYLQDQLGAMGLQDAELLWNGEETPKVTFDSLWLLLQPGSDVYVRENGKLNAYVIEAFVPGVIWGTPGARPRPYSVYVWNLNFDGFFLDRSVKKIDIPIFEGARDLHSLPLYPVQFHRDEDPQKSLRQQLINRGKKFINMVKQPTLQDYTGPSRLQGIRTFNNVRVVIDHTSQPWSLSYLDEDANAHLPVTYVTEALLGQRTRVPACPCKTCKSRDSPHTVQRHIFDDYEMINLESRPTLTDHQYFLCWSHVYGYVLKDRAWDVLEVSGLREPRIQKNIIDMLVMKPEENKNMIKAICETLGGSYAQDFPPDFVQGKGEGQILLLHGPPGTGKTLTAESVAEYTGRPLLSITAADLGHEPELLEYNLLQFFRNAQKWNAILLLDEADVYLESRSTQDLQRNSIVSIFLRALDYFQGILFLTTNRVGSFDEAFMSRIHVQIGYDPLDDKSRKQIWDNHFKKLSRNHDSDGRREIRCSYSAKQFVQQSDDLRALKWNGREIRNAFQTAVALACFQAKQDGDEIPELTDEHLNQVVKMSKKFKHYLKGVRGAEGEMAYAAQLRNDDIKAAVEN